MASPALYYSITLIFLHRYWLIALTPPLKMGHSQHASRMQWLFPYTKKSAGKTPQTIDQYHY
jgi:hypothetical protein